MRTQPVVVAALGLLVLPFLLIPRHLAHADDQVRFRTALEPCCGEPEPNAEGKAERRIQTKKGEVWKDRFKGQVEIPIPSPGLGISSPEEAVAADMRLILSRAGTPYAECVLALAEDEEDEGEAEYRVDVEWRVKKGVPILRQKKGTCNIDLATEGAQAGVPDVRAGDLVTAVRVQNPADRTQDLPFLEGVFTQD